MGRLKYGIRLIIRIAFVLLCFVLSFLFTAVGQYRTDEISMTDTEKAPYCTIITKNGAEAHCTSEKGMLVLDIVQSNDGEGEYDDIIITLKTAPVKYDTTFLQSIMGDKPKYAKYIHDMKEGPWSANINYRLMGESVLTTGEDAYSLRQGTDVVTDTLLSRAANTDNFSNDFTVSKNDEFTFDVIMGTQTSGPLPSGRYYLFAELNISGLSEQENVKLSYIESIPGLFKISVNALKTVGMANIFNVSSWLSFYFLTVVLGCLFFAYPDLRTSYRMAMEGRDNTVKVVYYVYINGFISGEAVDYIGTGGCRLVSFILFYLLLQITIPVRIVAQIINALIHLICGYDYPEYDPLFANIIGSVGVYTAILTIVALISALTVNGNYTLTVISGILAVALLIVANIMSKAKEDLY